MSAATPGAIALRNRCGIAAIAGAVLLIVAARQSGQAWLPSYLFVWLFVLGLSLGSLAWVAVHDLTGGHWGAAARPFAGAALRLFPLCAVLAIPLLVAPAQLLPWMHPASGAEGAGLAAGQHWYLNSPFFYVRGVVYFLVWLGLARLLREDGRRAPRQGTAAIGFVLYALTTTFAAIDWTMSLTPPWHSTVFGLLIGTGQALGALAGAIICANALKERVDAPLRARFHDLGNLTIALVLVWSYLALMQFLIMWIEDLPDEIGWMLLRTRTSWSALTWFLVFTHFLVPFVLLLSRGAKRAPGMLAGIGALVLIACLADSFWLVVPTFRPQGFLLQWSDVGALFAVGGAWLCGLIYVMGLPAAKSLHGAMHSGSGEHGTQRA